MELLAFYLAITLTAVEVHKMIIDVYNHILPKKYQETLERKVTGRDPKLPSSMWSKTVTTLGDLEAQFRIMDAFDGYIQVITVASPPTYAIAPQTACLTSIDTRRMK